MEKQIVSFLMLVALTGCEGSGSTARSSESTAQTQAAVSSTVQIDCGSATAVAPFSADVDFSASTTIDHANTINVTGVTNPAPAVVYQTARVGNFTYTIPGFTAGSSNTVRLHFAETYFTTTGSRVFNVSINGQAVLSNFDIFAATGAENKAIVEQFVEPASSSGSYVIVFTTVVNNSLISGIEVLPSSCTAGAVCTPANVCDVGTISCATGSPVCNDTGANSAANGTTCGSGKVCDNGTCGSCTAGVACTPTNPCDTGATSCATGSQVCADMGANPAANGAPCGTNMVCNSGACSACVAGLVCVPLNVCDTGSTSCGTGTSVCFDTGANSCANGTSCGAGKTCNSGQCN